MIYLFKNDEDENLIYNSINWIGTYFIKKELYNSLKDALVLVKQSTVCDCKIIQAKIIDPKTMLLIPSQSYLFIQWWSVISEKKTHFKPRFIL